ncbi:MULTISPECIES: hypothetical protein [unclassified Nostoc]|uniref:hypothetical protein n=1 Tax=unclassified Nostoc TaxID=2593658 RepID=UPI002610AEBD|nr:hypothetical protein [Nostoc sp. S13]MDF5735147.1 hypothetical protein [Nostoc sp. S13]
MFCALRYAITQRPSASPVAYRRKPSYSAGLPVSTTDSAALASNRASGTSLLLSETLRERVTLLRRYRYANTSRLRREIRLQRWIHRNALAPLDILKFFPKSNRIAISIILTNKLRLKPIFSLI